MKIPILILLEIVKCLSHGCFSMLYPQHQLLHVLLGDTNKLHNFDFHDSDVRSFLRLPSTPFKSPRLKIIGARTRDLMAPICWPL